MALEIYSFRVRSVTPLLCDNGTRKLLAAIKQPGAIGKPKQLTPEEEAELGTYRTAEGYLAGPAQGMRSAFLAASKEFKPTRGRGTMQQFLAHVEIVPEELIPLYDADGKPL